MARGKSFLRRFLRRDEEPDAEPEDGRDRFEPASLYAEFLRNFDLAQFEPSSQCRLWVYQPIADLAVALDSGIYMYVSMSQEHPMHRALHVSDLHRIFGEGAVLYASTQGVPYRQAELPFPVDEAEDLKSQLIDMAREVTALKKQNKELRQQVQKYGGTQDGLLARIKNYQKALEGMRIAAGQDAKGLLLFSERYNGRVEEVAADSMDVVFDDNDGGTFAQSYSSDQLAGAKMPEPGDRIYAFAAVYRSPAKPVSWNEILREDSGIEDLDFPVEEAEGSIDL